MGKKTSFEYTSCVANEIMVVTVSAKTAFNVQAESAGLSVELYNPSSGTRAKGKLDKKGQYVFRVRCSKQGENELRVKASGVHVNGSPVQVSVAPGTTSTGNSVAAVEIGDIVSGDETTFTISLKDDLGNAGVGGDNVQVNILKVHTLALSPDFVLLDSVSAGGYRGHDDSGCD